MSRPRASRSGRQCVLSTKAFAAALAALACAICIPASAAARQTGGPCSKQTAQALEPNPVGNVICGAFAGPGSQAMVVNVSSATCLPFVGWDVFVRTGGSWTRLRLSAHGGLTGYPVVAVGTDLRETSMVARPGQPICLASASRSRIWHWDGSALIAGAWTGVKARPTSTNPDGNTGSRRAFYTPSRNIQCLLSGTAAYCQTFKPPAHANLTADGNLDICKRGPICAGNAGEDVHFTLLPYGKAVSAGGFRCTSAFTGVTCVIVATGKGFLIARQGIKRLG